MSKIELTEVYHSYETDSFELRIDHLLVENGTITALVGESGCGKTTLLRAIAGLEIPAKGCIAIDDRKVCDEELFIPPERRNIGLVFQDYALFPHLTVRKNVEFGLRKLKPRDREDRLLHMTELTGLSPYLDRYPHELSGGQQQRVALTRALVCKPQVLLLDEPFSNMDEPLKVKLRSEVKQLLKETHTTTIMVSHDIRDAFDIADRIVILKNGTIEQTGTRRELEEKPVNNYVSSLVRAS